LGEGGGEKKSRKKIGELPGLPASHRGKFELPFFWKERGGTASGQAEKEVLISTRTR